MVFQHPGTAPLYPHLYRKGPLSKCDILPDGLTFSDLAKVSMRPDLSDNERLLSPDTGGGGEGERIRPGEGKPSTLTSWEQVVDFSQIYSGLARKVGDQHFAYMQVLAPSIFLITLKVPRARTFSLKKKKNFSC